MCDCLGYLHKSDFLSLTERDYMLYVYMDANLKSTVVEFSRNLQILLYA